MAKAESFAEPTIAPIRSDRVAVGFVLSVLLHAALVGVFYVTLPFFKKEPLKETPIIVDLVEVAEETVAPPKPTPKVEQPVEEPKPEPPKPAEEVKPPPPEPPPPEPPKKETPPPPPEKDEIAKIIEKTPTPPPPKPKPPEPKKKDDMAQLQDILKNMEKKKPNQAPPTPAQNAPQTNNQALIAGDRATMSELDAIRTHIEGCWRIDPGKEGIEKLSAEIRVSINPDGSVARAEVVDLARMALDRTFNSFATNARLSVLACKGIPITPAHYNELKEMTLNFSPQGRIN